MTAIRVTIAIVLTLNTITLDRLYTPPRSTCHQPLPSQGNETMFVPFFPSKSMILEAERDGSGKYNHIDVKLSGAPSLSKLI